MKSTTPIRDSPDVYTWRRGKEGFVTVSNHDNDGPDVSLSAKDVEFLRAVREINNDPESYDLTQKGTRPANTASIRETTSLNQNERQYRLKEGRKLEKHGLINVYEARPQNGTMGPKGVELTETGRRELELAEKSQPPQPGSEKWDLEERTSDIEDRIDRLEDALRRADEHFQEHRDGIAELEDAVSELQADLSDLREEHREMGAAVNELQSQPSAADAGFRFSKNDGDSDLSDEEKPR